MTTISPKIEESWKEVLMSQFESEYFQQLKEFLVRERMQYRIYPPGNQIFSAFNTVPFQDVKVVIIGQDPYHGPNQANGKCFSVNKGVDQPPSLKNIFREIKSDLGIPIPNHGDLTAWAEQGVLLLNAVLTVRAHQPQSHQKMGWEQFTDHAIKQLSAHRNGLVFLLWGRSAQMKTAIIDTSKHYVLKAPHPSPLSANRGFFGCRHFSKTNDILKMIGRKPIDWRLE